MRILVATLRYPPYVAGGYEQLTFDSVEALRARGHEVSVVCGRGRALADAPGVFATMEPALPEEGDEQNLFKLSHTGSNLDRARLHFLRKANQRACATALAETGADILFYFNLGLASLAPIAAARAAGVPTMGFVSDPWPLNHWLNDWRDQAGGTRPAKLRVLETAWHRFRADVDLGAFRVSSDFLRRRFIEDGIAAEDMRLLRVPLPPRMQPNPAVSRPPTRTPGTPLRVASLSMFWEGKGVHVLLEAAALARRQGADIELLLAGDGSDDAYRARLDELARVSDLQGRVRFLGLLDRAGAARMLSESHALVLPSIWGEPFPTATIEAMARGLAVIATDAGGTPEQFEHGTEGLIVPANDAKAMAEALVRVASDDAHRTSLGAAGLARQARDYTMERFTDGLEEAAMEALLQGPR